MSVLRIPPLDLYVLAGMLFIFGLRVIDVSLGTVRTIMVVRGLRKWAVIIGFLEITIWVVAISQVMANLNNIWNVLAYSGGFAAGTFVGMMLENRLALGNVSVNVFSPKKGAEIAAKVRQAGYGATKMLAEGHSGPVSMVAIVVPRRKKLALLSVINEADPTAFVTVEDMRRVDRGYGSLITKKK